MSTDPDVVITRGMTGNVTAMGGDELATTLLHRAGFIPQSSVHQHWHRLPWDMGEQRENEMASHAARMLTAVGYQVNISPDLYVGPITTPSDPRGTRTAGIDLLDLTDQLNGACTYAAAAGIVDHVLDPTDGVLARLHDFFEAAAEQANAAEDEAGFDLADRFTEAVGEVDGLSQELASAADEMRALGASSHAPPAWQVKAAHHCATADRHQPVKGSGPEASSAPQSHAPKPRRTR